MQTVKIEGKLRATTGKKSSGDSRRAGMVPCVVYGEKNIHFEVPTLALRDLIYTPDFRLAEITVDGQTVNAIVKEVQYHPLRDNVLHVDFLQLVPGRKFLADIPVRVTGNSVGVRKGGKLVTKVRKVRVKMLPEAMVDSMVIDVTELDLGKSLRVRDIELIEGVEIMNTGSIPVVTIDIPRALRSAQAEEAKETGKKKK